MESAASFSREKPVRSGTQQESQIGILWWRKQSSFLLSVQILPVSLLQSLILAVFQAQALIETPAKLLSQMSEDDCEEKACVPHLAERPCQQLM